MRLRGWRRWRRDSAGSHRRGCTIQSCQARLSNLRLVWSVIIHGGWIAAAGCRGWWRRWRSWETVVLVLIRRLMLVAVMGRRCFCRTWWPSVAWLMHRRWMPEIILLLWPQLTSWRCRIRGSGHRRPCDSGRVMHG